MKDSVPRRRITVLGGLFEGMCEPSGKLAFPPSPIDRAFRLLKALGARLYPFSLTFVRVDRCHLEEETGQVRRPRERSARSGMACEPTAAWEPQRGRKVLDGRSPYGSIGRLGSVRVVVTDGCSIEKCTFLYAIPQVSGMMRRQNVSGGNVFKELRPGRRAAGLMDASRPLPTA